MSSKRRSSAKSSTRTRTKKAGSTTTTRRPVRSSKTRPPKRAGVAALPARSPRPASASSTRFRIVDNWLEGPGVSHQETPNAGGAITPQYLVFHYTAGRSAQASVDWLMNPAAKASAHLVVGRDGTITQLASFLTKTWHAGLSHWNGLTGMNQYSIGIEMDNAGPFTIVGNNLQAWFGKTYPKSQAIYATHKLDTTPQWWHAYSEAQISLATELAILLVQQYGLKEVIGHEDIAPDRKRDPGPAFPLAHIQSLILGRAEEQGEWFRVTATSLNIRSGPGADYEPVASPLMQETRVLVLEKQDRWSKVEVHPSDTTMEKDIEGWVFNRYIEPLS